MAVIHDIEADDRIPALETRALSAFFGSKQVLKGVSLVVPPNQMVALIGPSGCGKSTLLRCFNRMNDLLPSARIEGEVLFRGQDLYHPKVDPVEVRRRIGMVFQSPNPFPKSVFENVAFGPRVAGLTEDLNRLVEESLKKVALWSEVSDRLYGSAKGLTSGQQQRLCIARALALGPEVLLMDEPASALDSRESQRIEELICDLKNEYTVVVVTNNMQRAARISDHTAFMAGGELVEYGPTDAIFTNPKDEATEAFVTGRFP
ncbi:phosphate ABC transporter ATP-binding protein PstB [Gemmatimonadota bacterium]